MLPAMTPFMTGTQAGLNVAYGTRAQNQTKWLKEVAPARAISDHQHGPGPLLQHRSRQNPKASIKTLIMVGWKISGSITHNTGRTMAQLYCRLMDTTSAGSDYETTIGFYNVLNSGNANLANQPLKPGSLRSPVRT